nr:hypothetical protein [Wenzhouxiangella limi]
MAMWSLDKILAPDHAAAVFESFYSISGMSAGLLLLAAIPMLAACGALFLLRDEDRMLMLGS